MDKRGLFLGFYLVFEIGFLLAVPIVVLLWGGHWLDQKLHTLPLFTILGAIFGATGGMINTYRAVIKIMERKK